MDEKLRDLLIEQFGAEKGEVLFKEAQKRYTKLRSLAANESAGRKKNLENSVYPFAAIYQALLADGFSREKAMEHMSVMMERKTLRGPRKMYERMGKLPFFFPLFCKMFSTGLKGDSWSVTWIAKDKEYFAYDITKCLWHDACSELGCPELCRIFCRNDEINFGNVSPRLHFRRSKALGYGGDCCDFRFYRHKPEAEE